MSGMPSGQAMWERQANLMCRRLRGEILPTAQELAGAKRITRRLA
jgi:hypothetical protein